MKLGGGKEWFTAAELAELALAGLPKAKRKINERAVAEGWPFRTSPTGEPLARARAGRGGGIEYHLDVLPASVRAALVSRGVAIVADVSAAPESRTARLWRDFDALDDDAKDKAKFRAGVLAMVDAYRNTGLTQSASVAAAAKRNSVSAPTVWNWLKAIQGVPRNDRLPFLAPQYGGGGKEADVDPDVWQILRSDYLRPEKPTFASCYDRARSAATARGLSLPCSRTLWRKLERETNPLVIVQRRNGAEALRHTLPPQKRSVAGLHALELVNIDGHRWDVFVEWPDGVIARPVMVAIQDVYSRKMLAWSIGRTESAVETRLALARLFQRHGIPRGILLDNGRAFASKWISGGAATRFRFKIKAEEPLGILTALGIQSHWAQPYRGQSKPIERAFRDFCDRIAKHPAFAGAYVGNKPDAKPENYGSRAVPIADFITVAEAGIAAHNAVPGRRTEMGKGVHSFDQVFEASYAVSPIGKATPEQLRLALLAADERPTDRRSGEIKLHGNRYWTQELSLIAGERVTVRFDPDDLHAPVHVYRRSGEYLCSAPVFDDTGFLDTAAAKRRKRLEKDLAASVKAMVLAEDLLEADEIAAMLPVFEDDDTPAAPAVIRPVRHRGQTAAALKTTSQTPLRALRASADPSLHDDLAAGLAGISRLRSVK